MFRIKEWGKDGIISDPFETVTYNEKKVGNRILFELSEEDIAKTSNGKKDIMVKYFLSTLSIDVLL